MKKKYRVPKEGPHAGHHLHRLDDIPEGILQYWCTECDKVVSVTDPDLFNYPYGSDEEKS